MILQRILLIYIKIDRALRAPSATRGTSNRIWKMYPIGDYIVILFFLSSLFVCVWGSPRRDRPMPRAPVRMVSESPSERESRWPTDEKPPMTRRMSSGGAGCVARLRLPSPRQAWLKFTFVWRNTTTIITGFRRSKRKENIVLCSFASFFFPGQSNRVCTILRCTSKEIA